jgi:hypothetical protein
MVFGCHPTDLVRLAVEVSLSTARSGDQMDELSWREGGMEDGRDGSMKPREKRRTGGRFSLGWRDIMQMYNPSLGTLKAIT